MDFKHFHLDNKGDEAHFDEGLEEIKESELLK